MTTGHVKTAFDKHVRTPTSIYELASHLTEFQMAGMAGALASSDATRTFHEMCAWRLRRSHKGGKPKHPTGTYNLTANHHCHILGSTRGHDGVNSLTSRKYFRDHVVEHFDIMFPRGELWRPKWRGKGPQHINKIDTQDRFF